MAGFYNLWNYPKLFPDKEVVLKELPIYNIMKDNYYYGTNYIY